MLFSLGDDLFTKPYIVLFIALKVQASDNSSSTCEKLRLRGGKNSYEMVTKIIIIFIASEPPVTSLVSNRMRSFMRLKYSVSPQRRSLHKTVHRPVHRSVWKRSSLWEIPFFKRFFFCDDLFTKPCIVLFIALKVQASDNSSSTCEKLRLRRGKNSYETVTRNRHYFHRRPPVTLLGEITFFKPNS